MKQKNRLRHRSDIAVVRQQGKRWSNRMVILWVHPNQLDHSRFGFVATKRLGNAVVRNRARRILREAIRLQSDSCQPGWDCLFIAQHSVLTTCFQEIQESIVGIWQQSNIWQSNQIVSSQQN